MGRFFERADSQTLGAARSRELPESLSSLRSSAVSLPLSQPGTGNNLKDLKEPKHAGWNFGFRAELSAIRDRASIEESPQRRVFAISRAYLQFVCPQRLSGTAAGDRLVMIPRPHSTSSPRRGK